MNLFVKLCFDSRKNARYNFFEKYFLDGMTYLGHTLANNRRKPASSTMENSCESRAIISAIQFVISCVVDGRTSMRLCFPSLRSA